MQHRSIVRQVLLVSRKVNLYSDYDVANCKGRNYTVEAGSFFEYGEFTVVVIGIYEVEYLQEDVDNMEHLGYNIDR